jgi:hypothetical protein
MQSLRVVAIIVLIGAIAVLAGDFPPLGCLTPTLANSWTSGQFGRTYDGTSVEFTWDHTLSSGNSGSEVCVGDAAQTGGGLTHEVSGVGGGSGSSSYDVGINVASGYASVFLTVTIGQANGQVAVSSVV